MILSRISLFAVLAAPVMMPEQLPRLYLENQGFLPFQEPGNSSAPFFTTMEINGATAHASQVREVFSDSTFAYLPAGTQILRLKDSSGGEVWEYPVGTEVAHKIYFNDQSQQIFELRMIRKVGEGQWDFASYSPEKMNSPDQTSPLKRNRYTGAEALSFVPELISGARPKIELKRLNLNSCRNCHSFSSSTMNEAGPCGFTPNNSVIQSWMDLFQKKFGYSPIRN